MRPSRRAASFTLATTATLALAACGATTPRVTHVVLFDLSDPAEAPALAAEIQRDLADLPMVRSMTVGAHLETGRPPVIGDYDLGMVLTYDSPEDYEAYVVHPTHEAFVAQWRPRLTQVRILDIDSALPAPDHP